MEIKLLTLAKKIASINAIDQDNLIPVFIKDTETVIKRIASNYIRYNQVSNIEELKNMLSLMKKRFIKILDKHGIKPDIISKIDNQLSDRFNIVFNALTAEWIINTVSYKKDLSNEQLIEALTDLLKKHKHLMGYGKSIASVLQEKGISTKLLDNFKKEINRIESEIDKKNSIERSFKLPKVIMRVKETKNCLKNEIYRNLRYNSSFSCISISVAWVSIHSVLKKTEIEELDKIIVEVTKILTSSLRKLDTIGTLGSLKHNHLLMVLQMTGKAGALVVKERLMKQFSSINIEVKGIQIKPIIALSSITFDKEKTADINSFLREVKKNLKDQKKLIIKV